MSNKDIKAMLVTKANDTGKNFKNQLKGYCHCGNISFTLNTNKTETDFTPRTCQCSFCKKHDASYISDPKGILEVQYQEGSTNKYRFGHSTADFIICKNCGVLTMALCNFDQETKAVINIKSMNDYHFSEADKTNFDAETTESRLDRRAQTWIGKVIIKHT